MIVGRIEFGPEVVITPQATLNGKQIEVALGFWKLLGLTVSVDMAPDNVCLDEDEMRRRNELARERLKRRAD